MPATADVLAMTSGAFQESYLNGTRLLVLGVLVR